MIHLPITLSLSHLRRNKAKAGANLHLSVGNRLQEMLMVEICNWKD
jgi:hypothetical protein